MYVKPNNPHPRLAVVTAEGPTKLDFLALFNDGFVIDDNHWLAGRPDIVTIKPLPEANFQRIMRPKGFVCHTQAGGKQASNEAAWSWFNRDDVTNESHLIGPEMDGLGRVIHCVPFNKVAHSNFQGNEWAENDELRGHLSIETQDRGAATLNNTPWTLQQLNVMAGIITACCFVYQIPCSDTVHYRSGGISPHNRWPQWSKDSHSCPGNARTRQMDWIRGEVAKRLANVMAHTGDTCPVAA